MQAKLIGHKSKKRAFNQISPTTNFIMSAVMIFIAAVFLLPLILVLSISLSSYNSIQTNGYQFIPQEWSLVAYEYMLQIGDGLWRSYAMTILYVSTGTLLGLFLMSMFAYVLTRVESRTRSIFTFYAFFSTMFSGGMVSRYILYTRYLNIDNTIWVFILPGLINAFNVIILRTFITTTIPDSLIESAKLDGASEWQIYLRIVMPLFKAGLASIGLMGMVTRWNDWFTGIMYVDDRKLVPVMTYLQRIQKDIEYLKSGTAAASSLEGLEMLQNLPTESARMAITILVILPLLVAYPFFQKYFVKGLTVGSVKG